MSLTMNNPRLWAAVALLLNAASFGVRYTVYQVAFTPEELIPVVLSVFFTFWALCPSMFGAQQAPTSFHALVFAALLATHVGSMMPTDPRKGGSALYPVAAAAAAFVVGLAFSFPFGGERVTEAAASRKAKAA